MRTVGLSRGWLLCILLSLLGGGAHAEPLRPLIGRERVHAVAAGENLYTISRAYGLAIEHLAFANHLPVGLHVPAGTRLVVPTRRVLPAAPSQDGLVVNLPERGFFLFRNGRFEKFYPVAIGSPGRFMTPPGEYTLVSRVAHPTWLPPEWAGMGETVVPAGPENPLGDRWMGLSGSGLGIHSTTSPTYIGAAVSHGCMRMYPEMAREVFEKVRVGMPVRIEYEPVKLGIDQETGEIYLAVFPDVYGMVDLEEEARKRLRELGILGLVGEEQLAKLLAAKGTPRLLFGSGTVLVDGEEIDADPPALVARGSLFMPGSVARALGMTLEYDAESRQITVSRDGQEAAFPVEDAAVMPRAYLWRGQALLPARPLLSQFGIAFRWEPDTRTLHIAADAHDE
ncbi:MAG: L,D-transpeptidase family protein [Armatimonadetes bacterium]|nr:L,D-transpeptidase family protein [Armatimonadota bacterium]